MNIYKAEKKDDKTISLKLRELLPQVIKSMVTIK